MPTASENRAKIVPRTLENRRRIHLGRFWAICFVMRSLQDALGTALVRKLGRLGCQVGRLGGHVGRLGRQVGSPRRSKRRLEPSPRSLRTHACDRPTARTLGRRFFVDFVLSRESRDVPRVPVFTVFCWLRTKSAPNARKRPRLSEISRFGFPNPRQERPRRLENPAKTHPKRP